MLARMARILACAAVMLSLSSSCAKTSSTTATTSTPSAGEPEPRLTITTSHTDRINTIAYSHDFRFVASAGSDQGVVIWHVGTGVQTLRLTGHSGAVDFVGFTSRDAALFTGSEDGTVRLWDIQTAREVHREKAYFAASHEATEGAFAISDDGKRGFFTTDSRCGEIIDLEAWRSLATFCLAKAAISGAGLSPDGSRLALSTSDGVFRLFDVATRRSLWEESDGDFAFGPIAFSHDGRYLVAPQLKPNIRDVSDGHIVLTLLGHGLLILEVAFSADDRTIATAGWDGNAKLWDAANGELRATLRHPEPVAAIELANDNHTAVTASWDGALRLWNIDEQRTIPRFTTEVNRVTDVGFSDDGSPYVIAATLDNAVVLWTPASGAKLKRFVGHRDSVFVTKLAGDGQTLLTAGGDQTASVWNVATESEIWRLEPHSQYVRDAAFTRDGGTIVTAGGGAYVWDALGRTLRTRIGGSDITSVAFRAVAAPTGNLIATSGVPGMGSDKTVIIRDMTSGAVVATLQTDMMAAAFDPAGQSIVVGRDGPQAQLFDARSGAPGAIFRHEGKLNAVTFSVHGQQIITGGADRTVRIWDRKGTELQRLTLPRSVSNLAVSPDGKLLLVATQPDNVAHLWRLETTPREVAQVITFRDGTWLAADGARFDTNNPDNLPGLAWTFSDPLADPLAPEVFMRDFFSPRLVESALQSESGSRGQSLVGLDREQPTVKIASIERARGEPVSVFVNLDIAIRKAGPGMQPREIHGLHVLRDGRRAWLEPADGGRVVLDPSGRARVRLGPIRLAQRRDAYFVEIGAYAFNESGVKSRTDHAHYKVDGGTQEPRTAYVISMGVGANRNARWALDYAAQDAEAINDRLTRLLRARPEDYAHVATLSLVSRPPGVTGAEAPAATKDNFRRALLKLSRLSKDAEVGSAPWLSEVHPAGPSDVVVIFYSGHGYRDNNGVFYLVPFDTPTGAINIAAAKSSLISSDELAEWLADVDAGDITLIIDACHAAGSVDAPDFKPGPMGSSGLGQLAYDKGIRVLGATHADTVALEAKALNHGLLTYALVAEGLDAREADRQPRDGTITLAEWLQFGVDRVPALYRELRTGGVQYLGSGQRLKDAVFDVQLESAQSSKTFAQQPVLFDFHGGASPVLLGTAPYAAMGAASGGLAAEALDKIPSAQAFEDASGIRNPVERVDALQAFLVNYPRSPEQSVARFALVQSLLEVHANPTLLVGSTRDFDALLRDSSPTPLRARTLTRLQVGAELGARGEQPEAALNFFQEGRRLIATYLKDKKDPVVEREYAGLIERVALNSRADSTPIRSDVPLHDGVNALFYGDRKSAIGQWMLGELKSAMAGMKDVTLTSFEPPPNIMNRREPDATAVALRISATPTIVLVDASRVIRFRNVGLTPDLHLILEKQLKGIRSKWQCPRMAAFCR